VLLRLKPAFCAVREGRTAAALGLPANAGFAPAARTQQENTSTLPTNTAAVGAGQSNAEGGRMLALAWT